MLEKVKQMLKKLCRCGKVIEYNQKRCDECEQQAKQQQAKRHKHYDRYKRNQKSKAFYESRAWRRTRKNVLARYKGLDIYDFFINKTITHATTIHHIVELTDNWSRRLDTKNLIPALLLPALSLHPHLLRFLLYLIVLVVYL